MNSNTNQVTFRVYGNSKDTDGKITLSLPYAINDQYIHLKMLSNLTYDSLEINTGFVYYFIAVINMCA